MRCGLWLLAGVSIAACVPVGPSSVPAAPEQRARTGAVSTVLKGAVSGPTGLRGQVPGRLINLDGGSLINLDGGGLQAGAATYALAQSGLGGLRDVTVVAARADGVPLVPNVTVRTEAGGRFTLRVPGRGGVLVAYTMGPDGRVVRLVSLMHEGRADGEVVVSPASTLVAMPLLATVKGSTKNFSRLNAAVWREALEAAAPIAEGLSPEVLADPAAVLRAWEAGARSSAALARAVEALQAALAGSPAEEVVLQPAASEVVTPPASRPPASPAASPAAALPAASPASRAPETPRPVASPVTVNLLVQGRGVFGNCFSPTRTGLMLEAGDQVQLTATGMIQVESDNAPVGPGGEARTVKVPEGDCRRPLPDAPWGALIRGVGTAEEDPTTYTLAGRTATWTAPAAGMLYLGVNDGWMPDNQGQFDVTLTVTRGSR